jgi:hypothetical protein
VSGTADRPGGWTERHGQRMLVFLVGAWATSGSGGFGRRGTHGLMPPWQAVLYAGTNLPKGVRWHRNSRRPPGRV